VCLALSDKMIVMKWKCGSCCVGFFLVVSVDIAPSLGVGGNMMCFSVFLNLLWLSCWSPGELELELWMTCWTKVLPGQ
jgi:hypothetical protein